MSKTRGTGQHPAVVASRLPSPWASCRIIVPNLMAACRAAFRQGINAFSLVPGMTDPEISKLAQSIYQARPDRIILLDHHPHPGQLIQALASLYGRRSLPPLYIHLYGNFTQNTKRWAAVEPCLRGAPVKFLAASHRQVELVSRFTRALPGTVVRSPYPVDHRFYKSSPALRATWRRSLGIAKDELAIVYAGRISLQKNSLLLVQRVLAALRAGLPLRLILAGPFDDMGAPFFGLRFPRGYYFQAWRRLLDEAGVCRKKLTYVGNLKASELIGLYNAADVYASLSLHHDEDFGMAPAEALCCGTPVVLSDWGGHASFAFDRTSCELLETRLAGDSLHLAGDGFISAIQRLGSRHHDHKLRRQRARAYSEALSIDAASARLRELYASVPPPFQGFSPLLKQHAAILGQPVPSRLYKKIYGAYATP